VVGRCNGGPRGSPGRRQLLDGDGEVENDSRRASQQEDHLARRKVRELLLMLAFIAPGSFTVNAWVVNNG